jgi:hypothetical protein
VRVLLLAVVACAAGCLRTSAPPEDEFGADAPADEFTAEQAKALIPEAAGIPGTALRDLFAGADHMNFRPPNGYSLTWAVMTVWDQPVFPTSFFPGAQINLSRIAATMAGPKDKDGSPRPYESLIQPEYITDCTCKVDGDTATGTVSFKGGEDYEGTAGYTARKREGQWRIEEFRLPALKITTTLGADGKWVKK